MPSRNVIIAVTLSILMVMSAGCAGWGTDGPANPDEETDGNEDVQTNESPADSQETESDDPGTEEEQGSEENSDASTDSAEESSSGEDTDETDTNGPSETDDGETVDSTKETDTTDETETDSSQTDSNQGDTSPSSNGDGDNGDRSPASGGVQTSESPGDSQETESDDSGTDKTDANGPSETDDGKTVDSTGETETPEETETGSSQAGSDQGDESPSSNGGDDNGEGSPASGGNDENGGEGPPENGGGDDGDSDENGDEGPTNGNDNGANGNDENGEQVTCDAFSTQEEAQEYFDENPEERGHLDENDDGIPCEHLPSEGNGAEDVYTITVEADSPVTLDQDQAITFPVEYHPPEQEVTITVTDEENTPIEGASVEVDDKTKETDEDGTVQFSLIDGEYGVSVSAEGYQDGSTTIEIDHENKTFSVTLKESNGNGGGTSSLVVSNIHADAARDDHENLNDEYIELTNKGSSAIHMRGWTLSDEANHVYDFPSEFTLESGDSVTIYTGSGSDSDSQLYWGSGSAVWNNGGDTIIVTNSDGETVIQLEYSN